MKHIAVKQWQIDTEVEALSAPYPVTLPGVMRIDVDWLSRRPTETEASVDLRLNGDYAGNSGNIPQRYKPACIRAAKAELAKAAISKATP